MYTIAILSGRCIRQELDQQNKEPVPVFIIGNKSDLNAQREVTPQMGEKVIKQIYLIFTYPGLTHMTNVVPHSVAVFVLLLVHARRLCCQMAESCYVHGFMETSALDNTNVQQSFHQLAQAMTEINNPKLVSGRCSPTEVIIKPWLFQLHMNACQ